MCLVKNMLFMQLELTFWQAKNLFSLHPENFDRLIGYWFLSQSIKIPVQLHVHVIQFRILM